MSSTASVFDPVPSRIDDILDPAWLSRALAVDPDKEQIVEVECVGGFKTIASKVRFTATFVASDGARRVGHYCVKSMVPFEFRGVREDPTLGERSPVMVREALWYRDVLPSLGVRAPVAHYVGALPDSGRALIIMDDIIGLGGRVLGPDEPYALDTVRGTLAELARLHAATWGDDVLRTAWPPSVGVIDRFPDDVFDAMLKDGRCDGAAPALCDGRTVKDAMRAHVARPGTSIMHGDAHAGNAYLDAAGRAGWIDWQGAQWSHWSSDVAYHIASSLDVAQRQAHEQELLEHYLAERERHGIAAPSWEEAWDDYRAGFTWGFFMWAVSSIVERSLVELNMPRLATAIEDHDTFGRLGIA